MTTHLLIALVVLIVSATGCFGGPRTEGTDDPAVPERDRAPVVGGLDPTALYRQAGLIAEAAPLPFVGAVHYLASPSPDSTLVLLTLSMANRALTFSNEGDQQRASYSVSIEIRQGATTAKQLAAREVVRVGSYKETTRTDESVIFQQLFFVPPGQFVLAVAVSDDGSARNASHEQLISVPRFVPGTPTDAAPGGSAMRTLSSPIAVYEATPRTSRDSLPRLIANPRSTVIFGRDSVVQLYLEGYGLAAGAQVELVALDEKRVPVWADTVMLDRHGSLAATVLDLPIARIGVGQIVVAATVTGSADTVRVPLFVSFGEEWAILGYEEMLNYLRFFTSAQRLQALRVAPPEQRAMLWGTFWRETDPDPATPEHEALRDYFRRLQAANERFREEGAPGWLTDRGMVFLTLGEPDQLLEQGETSFSQRGRAQIWEYDRHRLQLVFIDQSGFGRWRLTSSSEVDFQSVAQRERR